MRCRRWRLAFGSRDETWERMCAAHPLDIIPLSWSGGDALHDGLALFDAQPSDACPPAVSCPPATTAPSG
jgi:hypothetical protein